MSGTIYEFFGYRASDRSPQALDAAQREWCPYRGETCSKRLSDGTISGVCTIQQTRSGPVICCPIRMYAEHYRVLGDVSDLAFGVGKTLVPGARAIYEARAAHEPRVAVFGHDWGGELRLPKREGPGNYFVDWILALVDGTGTLQQFVAIEVQTIDTTGNYRPSRTALLDLDRSVVRSTVGLNWENVNKRIIPQLIYKGQVLQREEMCRSGLFFICPTPVYDKITTRLGGVEGLIKYARQPAAITFLAYGHHDPGSVRAGQTVPLQLEIEHTTTVYKMQERFNNITLPDAGVYAHAIRQALGEE